MTSMDLDQRQCERGPSDGRNVLKRIIYGQRKIIFGAIWRITES